MFIPLLPIIPDKDMGAFDLEKMAIYASQIYLLSLHNLDPAGLCSWLLRIKLFNAFI